MILSKIFYRCFGDNAVLVNDTMNAAILPICFASLAAAVSLVVAYLFWKRYYTWLSLHKNGIPTVYWRPRFVNYRSGQLGDKQMSSSTIRNILPRMQRLQGPFGMYGTVYGLSTSVVHVAHPVPAHAILSSSYTKSSSASSVKCESSAQPQRRRSSSRLHGSGSSKAPAYNHFKSFCGDGVFTADGEDWKQKRAAVTHALLKTEGGFDAKLEREANLAARKLVRTLRRLTQRNSSAINILPVLQRATVGLIFRYITHADLEEKLYGQIPENDEQQPDDRSTASTVSSAESEEDKAVSSKTDQNDGGLLELFQSYLESIVQIRMIILAKSRSIWFLLPQWCYKAFSAMWIDEEFTMVPIRKFSSMACQSAIDGSPLAALQKLPLYQSLGDGFSKNLLDEAITLLFAGQDTSAATLSWTLHLLSLSPDVQNKLADEVQTVLKEEGADTSENDVSKRILAKMPYLDAVIKESMRLYPVAPFVVRRLPFPVTVGDEDKSVTLPGNSVACVWIYSLHRNPEFWTSPNDFIPERWLAAPEDADAGISNGAYMPFAAGPRNCVGQPLAHVILRTLLSRLVAQFEFQDPRLLGADSNQNVADLRKDMQAGFTVLPKDGVNLLIRQRKGVKVE